jgi:hypothetical protein
LSAQYKPYLNVSLVDQIIAQLKQELDLVWLRNCTCCLCWSLSFKNSKIDVEKQRLDRLPSQFMLLMLLFNYISIVINFQ